MANHPLTIKKPPANCPNAFFVKCLIEWRDEARAKNSKRAKSYITALGSLLKYPAALPTGRNCRILEGFGPKICEMLDKKLAERSRNDASNSGSGPSTNSGPSTSMAGFMQPSTSSAILSQTGSDQNTSSSQPSTSQNTTPQPGPSTSRTTTASTSSGRTGAARNVPAYKPRKDTAAWVTICAFANGRRGSFTYQEALELVVVFARTRGCKPPLGRTYEKTLDNLVNRGLLLKVDRGGPGVGPENWRITEEGMELARRIDPQFSELQAPPTRMIASQDLNVSSSDDEEEVMETWRRSAGITPGASRRQASQILARVVAVSPAPSSSSSGSSSSSTSNSPVPFRQRLYDPSGDWMSSSTPSPPQPPLGLFALAAVNAGAYGPILEPRVDLGNNLSTSTAAGSSVRRLRDVPFSYCDDALCLVGHKDEAYCHVGAGRLGFLVVVLSADKTHFASFIGSFWEPFREDGLPFGGESYALPKSLGLLIVADMEAPDRPTRADEIRAALERAGFDPDSFGKRRAITVEHWEPYFAGRHSVPDADTDSDSDPEGAPTRQAIPNDRVTFCRRSGMLSGLVTNSPASPQPGPSRLAYGASSPQARGHSRSPISSSDSLPEILPPPVHLDWSPTRSSMILTSASPSRDYPSSPPLPPVDEADRTSRATAEARSDGNDVGGSSAATAGPPPPWESDYRDWVALSPSPSHSPPSPDLSPASPTPSYRTRFTSGSGNEGDIPSHVHSPPSPTPSEMNIHVSNIRQALYPSYRSRFVSGRGNEGDIPSPVHSPPSPAYSSSVHSPPSPAYSPPSPVHSPPSPVHSPPSPVHSPPSPVHSPPSPTSSDRSRYGSALGIVSGRGMEDDIPSRQRYPTSSPLSPSSPSSPRSPPSSTPSRLSRFRLTPSSELGRGRNEDSGDVSSPSSPTSPPASPPSPDVSPARLALRTGQARITGGVDPERSRAARQAFMDRLDVMREIRGGRGPDRPPLFADRPSGSMRRAFSARPVVIGAPAVVASVPRAASDSATSAIASGRPAVVGDDEEENVEARFESFNMVVKSIVLCVDHAESTGNRRNENEMNQNLSRKGVASVPVHLNLGDYLWLAVENENTDITSRKTVILPVIVERKTRDDLWKSVKDGRWREQKSRLAKCGLRTILLIEGRRRDEGDRHMSTDQALVNAVMRDGMSVLFSDGMVESADHLSRMTRELEFQYKNKTVTSVNRQDYTQFMNEDFPKRLMPFAYFQAFTKKTPRFSVYDVFAQQLMQLKGMSETKAKAIVTVYPTARALLAAYDQESSERNKTDMLKNLIDFGTGNKIGPVLSRNVYQLFTMGTYP